MNTCDPGIVEIILGFSVGGMGLRAAIAWVKKKTGAKDFMALLLSFGMCAGAVVIYMSITGWVWDCFLFWACLVFAGTQTAYRLSHKSPITLP